MPAATTFEINILQSSGFTKIGFLKMLSNWVTLLRGTDLYSEHFLLQALFPGVL
jgi:hypothetical protein